MVRKNFYFQYGVILITVLFALVPFHAAVVTIIGASIDFKPALQLWKEMLIGIILLMCFVAYLRNRSLFRLDTINILALSIILLSLLITIIFRPDTAAILAGIKTNLVVLSLFFAVQVVSEYFSLARLQKIILWPATLVAVIAILQPWIFTPYILEQIGYTSNSIIAGQYIESSRSALRVFSTLGGPNQLGAYLIIPITLCLTLAVRKKQWLWLLAVAGFSLPLYMTYSRSAWLGAVTAVLTAILICTNKRVQLGAISALAVLVLVGTIIASQVNICQQFPSIASQILHGDCSSGTLSGSDFQRLTSQKLGLTTVEKQPIGYGLGSAGPASFFGNAPLITENWYLQIAIEVGVLGLVLYLALFGLLAFRLYVSSQSHSPDAILSATLFAVLCGLMISSLFLHTLADSTLGILLFGLLGIQKSRITA